MKYCPSFIYGRYDKTLSTDLAEMTVSLRVSVFPQQSFFFCNSFRCIGDMEFYQNYLLGNIYTSSVFCYYENKKKNCHPLFHETVPVTYEPAVPVAVLNTDLLCIEKRIFHSQNGTTLIKD